MDIHDWMAEKNMTKQTLPVLQVESFDAAVNTEVIFESCATVQLLEKASCKASLWSEWPS